MSAPRSSIRFAHDDQHITYQVHGWGTLQQSLPFRQHAERRLAEGCQCLEVDLRHCDYLDSTFLGTLLFLLRACKGSHSQFKLVSPSSSCQELLNKMKMDRVYPIDWHEEPDSGWRELPTPDEDRDNLRFNAVAAHGELAKLPGEAGDPFRAVVKGLIDEIQDKRVQVR